MALDFAKFDALVNAKEVDAAMKAAPTNEEVPKGTYVVTIDNMEIKLTKSQDKLMFEVQMRIRETLEAPKRQNNRVIFFRRVICGNKVTDKWNDSKAIAGVITWINNLLLEDEQIAFTSYSQLADDVLDIMQKVCDDIEVKIEYDPEQFNPIKILDVYDK